MSREEEPNAWVFVLEGTKGLQRDDTAIDSEIKKNESM